jgi:nucleoside-diphosphate-sugar epimerase
MSADSWSDAWARPTPKPKPPDDIAVRDNELTSPETAAALASAEQSRNIDVPSAAAASGLPRWLVVKFFVTGGSGFVGGALIRFLVARGDTVVALARSSVAAETVRGLGATPVPGGLDDTDALRAGAAGADVVVHAAAHLAGGAADRDTFLRVNVDGTRNVLSTMGSTRLVYVSTEQVVMDGPLVDADETVPYAARPVGPYAETKQLAERLVVAAGGVAVRPRMVWGDGDPTLLPTIVQAVRSGRFRWVAGGRQRTSTCHVDNVAAGIVAAAERGRAGEAYFLTDGQPVVFRDFWTALLATQGVSAPAASLPRSVAIAAAAVAEVGWRMMRRPGQPPLDRMTVALLSDECTLRDDKARRELGYAPPVSREVGLTAMRRR